MKMLPAIEFSVPRRPDTGAGAPTSVISPLLPQTYGSPRFCSSPASSSKFVRHAGPDTVPLAAYHLPRETPTTSTRACFSDRFGIGRVWRAAR